MVLGHADVRLFEEVLLKNFPKDQKQFAKDEVVFILSEMTNVDKYIGEKKRVTPFKVFKYFVRYCLYRNLANFDTLILITGDKGVGKSSFAIMLAKEWCRLLGLPFNPNHYIAYTNAQMVDKIDNLNKFSPLIADESINFCCLSEESNVIINNKKTKIKKIVGQQNFLIKSYNQKTKKIENKKAKKCIYIGKRMVYEIETENGKKIQCTKEHEFLCKNGEYKQLNQLKRGDLIVTT
jgi:predicted PilT family ATPase